MWITKNEIYYYLVVTAAIAILMFADDNGAEGCMLPFSILLIGWGCGNLYPKMGVDENELAVTWTSGHPVRGLQDMELGQRVARWVNKTNELIKKMRCV